MMLLYFLTILVIITVAIALNYKYKWANQDQVLRMLEDGDVVWIAIAFLLWPLTIIIVLIVLAARWAFKHLIPK